MADIDGDALQRAIDGMRAESVLPLVLDVTEESSWRDVLDTLLARHGALDILVNSAGIQITRRLEDLTLEEWRRIFAVNAEGTFLGTKLAIDAMKAGAGGAIVNVSSTYAMVADGLNAAYCASKAAVHLFTKSAALYCADNGYPIRINSVHPGVIMTPMLEREIRDVAALRKETDTVSVNAEWENISPLGVGRPEDIAQGILYLVSDAARYVTGTELVIDGGHLAR
jgi:NAD(P)-dependent dehydrogenase (short-subunit alcohol dehydrogenase family)